MNRQTITAAVLQMARDNPEMGQFSVAEVLAAKNIKISPSGVRSIWKRHGLETIYQRLLARTTASAAEVQLSPAHQELLKRKRVSHRLRQRAEEQDNTLTDIRREELLQAAAKIFSRKGYSGTSLKEICASAGIQTNSLYYHFKSKEELFAAVHQRGMERTITAIQESISTIRDPSERLEQACATAVRYILDRNAYAVIARVEVTTCLTPRLKRRLNADRAKFEEIFRELIETVPLAPSTDKSLLRLALLGAMNWTNAWYKSNGKLSPEEIGRTLVRNILANHRKE